MHNVDNSINHYFTFEYDNVGNVLNEKYYSYVGVEGTIPKLISEISFKYDDKNNPFKIYEQLGRPGLYTNTNNVIETYSTLYEEVPGIDKYSKSTTKYEYNANDFPVKVIADNSKFDYHYE